MPASDCGCKDKTGTVRATRLSGYGAGAWGSAHEGDTVDVPCSVVEANPEYWGWPGKPVVGPVPPVEALQEPEDAPVPEEAPAPPLVKGRRPKTQ